jgi:hypothetical protein
VAGHGTPGSRGARAPGRAPRGGPPSALEVTAPVGMLGRLPSMEKAELAVLQENALRLARDGTKPQQAAALDLLPAIEAELAGRQAAKQEAARARASEATRKRAATAAKARAAATDAKAAKPAATDAKAKTAAKRATKGKGDDAAEATTSS